jgi:NAD(P)-dependent dehydrogenase (short-subunit alcohol dehydrogenase family)
MASTPPDGEAAMVWWSRRHPPANPTESFAGKTVLITGANAGLGFEASLKFAALGASRLIFGVRTLWKGEEARSKICQQTGYSKDNIHLYELDMSTFDSVKRFAVAISREERIDIAILNAGVVSPSFRLSPEGYEMTVQVMVLSTALLAILIIPQLRKSAMIAKTPAHLEIVASIACRSAKIDCFSQSNDAILNQVNQAKFFGVQRQYQMAKLFQMYILEGLVQGTRSIECDPGDPGIIINAVCPGPCKTTIGRDFSTILQVPMLILQSIFFRTAEQGARSYVSGAILGPECHGKLWNSDIFLEYVQHQEGYRLSLLIRDIAWGNRVQAYREKPLRRRYGRRSWRCCDHTRRKKY